MSDAQYRHKTNKGCAGVGIIGLFGLPTLILAYLAFQAHDGRACEGARGGSCWPTEEYFAAYAGLAGVFLLFTVTLLILLARK